MRGELLEGLERLGVAEHRAWFEGVLGRPWAPAHAYRWIRFESPDPFGALLDAGERMEALWREDGAAGTLFAEREAADLEPLEAMARRLGYAGG